MEALRRKSAESLISDKSLDSVFFHETSTPAKPLLEDGGTKEKLDGPQKEFSQSFMPRRADSIADTIDVNDSVSVQKRRIRKSEDSKSTSTSLDLEEDFDTW